MEHSVTYKMDDGTEYQLTYDNESGDQMHYLLHEDGVLKLECKHHALPGEMDETQFKSVVVPGLFFTCIGKNIQAEAQRRFIREENDPVMNRMLPLISDHVQLQPHESEYLESIVERGHSVELFVQLAQEAQVERFSRQLSEEPDYTGTVVLSGEEEDEEDYVRPAYGKLLAIVLVVGLAAIGTTTALVEIFKLFGWR